jgi:hypothetical protein
VSSKIAIRISVNFLILKNITAWKKPVQLSIDATYILRLHGFFIFIKDRGNARFEHASRMICKKYPARQ